MSKIFYWIFLSITFISMLLLFACNLEPEKPSYPNGTVSPSNLSITTPKPSSTDFSASLIPVINSNGQTNYAVLFKNNKKAYSKFSCIIRQHDANGSYLSDYTLISDITPPNSHLIAWPPSHVNKGLTIENLQLVEVPPFKACVMELSDISIVRDVPANGTGDKTISFLTGTLYNTGTLDSLAGVDGNGVTPKSINFQILARTVDGNFTLAGDGSPYSTPFWARKESPMPPPKEKIIFYIPLNQNISIIDYKKAYIDGEITVFAPGG